MRRAPAPRFRILETIRTVKANDHTLWPGGHNFSDDANLYAGYPGGF
jgi:hypothetical protein